MFVPWHPQCSSATDFMVHKQQLVSCYFILNDVVETKGCLNPKPQMYFLGKIDPPAIPSVRTLHSTQDYPWDQLPQSDGIGR